MKVLIACEFSGIVRDAFTSKGHYAVSCDFLPTERPRWKFDSISYRRIFIQQNNKSIKGGESMKRKTLKMLKCSICGESDYGDYMDTIDGKIYCPSCALVVEDEMFNQIYEERGK